MIAIHVHVNSCTTYAGTVFYIFILQCDSVLFHAVDNRPGCPCTAAGPGAPGRMQGSAKYQERARPNGRIRGLQKVLPQVRASDASNVDAQPSTSGASTTAGRLLIDRRQLLTGAAASVVSFVGCPCPICKPGEAKAAGWSYGAYRIFLVHAFFE